jgi:hypothetical protein
MLSRRRLRPRFTRLLLASACALALGAGLARADPAEELARLRQEAAQMRKSLDGLDERIRQLEQQIPDSRSRGDASPSPGASPAPISGERKPDAAAGAHPAAPTAASVSAGLSSLAEVQKNWSRVVAGTPQAEVEALLGRPDHALRIDGSLVWYYAYSGIGKGSVFFDVGGKVTSAQSPRFGWSW